MSLPAPLRRRSALLPALALLFAAPEAAAQNLRDAGDPTNWSWYGSQSLATIQNFLSGNQRWLTGISVDPGSPGAFSVSYVSNAGNYSSATANVRSGDDFAQLQEYLRRSPEELTDLDSWTDAQGVTRYVYGTRSATANTAVYTTSDPNTVLPTAASLHMRPYLVTSNVVNGVLQWTVALRADPGSTYAFWGNVTEAFLHQREDLGEQISDLEVRSNGRFNAVMRSAVPGLEVLFRGNLTTSEMQRWRSIYGGRVFDLQKNAAGNWALLVVQQLGDYSVFGVGCNGTAGVPTQTVPSNPPQLGTSVRYEVRNRPASGSAGAWWMVGDNALSFSGIPLPLDLGILGAAGCPLQLDPFLSGRGNNITNGARVLLTFPPDPLLDGYRFHLQWLVSDVAANTLGFTTSDMITTRLHF